MKLRILNCEKCEKNFKISFEYLEGEEFYPNGKGGQLGDLGTIGKAHIVEVLDKDIIIDSPLEIGEYEYTIDPIRRDDARENHSGEHVFSAIAFLKYGWRTVGFRMAENYCTLDFDVSDVTAEMVKTIEEEVNLKIKTGFEVIEKICSLEEAQPIMGDRKNIPDKIKGDVRILSTFPEDFNACAGLHVKNIKDIRVFKVLGYERIKSTYTRFYFISGNKAIIDYNFKHDIISKLGVKFSCQPENLIAMIDKNIEDKKRVEKEKKELEIKYSNLIFKDLILNPKKILTIPEIGKLNLFFIDETREINDFVKKSFLASDLEYLLVTYSDSNFSISSSKVDCTKILSELKTKYDVKGGGNSNNINFKSSESGLAIIEFLITLYN